MATEKQVRDVLIEAFQILREQHNALHSLISEVAAIRESLIEIGPKYGPILSGYRAQHREETGPSAREDLRRFDEIIERLSRLP